MKLFRSVLTALLLLPALALAALPAVQPPVRYMALGDSIAAGYKAMPATAGYAYQLYLGRAFRSGRNVGTTRASGSARSASVA